MIFHRRTYRPTVSARESALTLAGFVGLACLVGWFAREGTRVDPDLFRLDDRSLAKTRQGPTLYEREVVETRSVPIGLDPVAALLIDRLPGLAFRRTGAPEVYDFDSLYEKINGRETLYKSYGFRKLWWASYEDGSESLDLEIFQQESPMAAFGVFSAERAGLTGAGLEPTRTITPNGLYWVVEDKYIRAIGSSDSPAIRKAAESAYLHLTRGLGGEPAAPAPPEGEPASPGDGDGHVHTCPAGYDEPCTHPTHLPTSPTRAGSPRLSDPATWTPLANPLVDLGADPAGLEFHREYGLGLEAFAGLYTAPVTIEGTEVRLFLLPAADPEAARAAFEAYGTMLSKTGDPHELAWPPGTPEARAAAEVSLLDTFEAGFAVDRWVAGVTEVEDRDAAAAGIARLVGLLVDEANGSTGR